MKTEPSRSAYARGESSARRWGLQVALGIASFVFGSILSTGASTRIAERVAPVESELLAWAFDWFFQRLWLFSVLPLLGYALARFSARNTAPLRFAVVAGLAWEMYSVLLTAGISGFESLVESPVDALVRLATLGLGLGVTVWAGHRGRDAAFKAQDVAAQFAKSREAEYAAFQAEQITPEARR